MRQCAEVLLESHEDRLQLVERATSDLLVHAESGKLQLDSISNQISQLGSSVTKSVERLGSQVEQLSTQTIEHHNALEKLTNDRVAKIAKKKRLKQIGIGLLVAVASGGCEQFGIGIWSMLGKLFHG